MKILLIQPKFKTHLITPPLGLGYLASSLRQDNHYVQLLDCVAHNINILDCIERLKPDFIGITVISPSYTAVIDLIANIRHVSNAKIVIGGCHATALPEQSLRYTKADYCIIGEGEITFRELCSYMDYHDVKGIAYWNNNSIVINQERKLIQDLDSIPFPAWDLLNPNNYPPTPHGAFYKQFPIAPITTTRGCPYNCIFCASKVMWRQKLRVRSSKNVVDEIEYLNTKFGVREFHFEDDNFTFSKQHAMDVCTEIIRRGIKISWACPNGVRIDKLDKELISVMKQSGCYQLSFGIESGNQSILNSINKHLDIKAVPHTINMIKDAGILTCGFFMIGLPDDTEKTVKETTDFALSVPFDRAQFSRFLPLPGTKPFEEWYKNGNVNWNFFGDTTYKPKNLRSEDVIELQKKAFRKFYMRPKTLIKTLFSVKPKQYIWVMKRLGDYGL